MFRKSYIPLGIFVFLWGLAASAHAEDFKCRPTPEDLMGPFYKPGAPVRNSVGAGYVLTGTVKSALDCLPVADARIEFWLTGSNGKYNDDHRATVFADDAGSYRFQSNIPPGYGYRPPHIHIRVSADGFKPLVTQHYPDQGDEKGHFNLVLVPDR